MVKKSNIFGIVLLLGLACANMGTSFASDNNLVQLDLKKSSGSSVDLTFFTSNQYQDNIVVRKKSDNKYVILMPKVLTSGYSSPDLNGVKDLISNIDVKSINESGNSYTKITLITTKPLDIKTRAQKSTPVTAEQQEYKTLIAEANSVKNNIGKNNNVPKPEITQKTNVTVNKSTPPKPEVKQELSKPKLTEIDPKTSKKAIENSKINTTKIKENQSLKEIVDAKNKELASIIPSTLPVEAESPIKEPQKLDNNIKDIKELVKKQKNSLPNLMPVLNSIKTKTQSIINKVEGKLPVSIPTALMLILIPLVGIITISKLIKGSLNKSKILKQSFMSHLAERPPILNTLRYNNIVNNDELTWQEKYQKYLSESAKPIPRGNNKGSYTFIKQPAPSSIEQKRQDLERLITPDMVPQQEITTNQEIIKIHNEEDSIQEELHTAIKLKAFEKNANMTDALSMSHRDKIKSRFKKYEEIKPHKVQKNVELGSSVLHANPRRMKDSNLNISNLQGTNNRGSEMNYNPQDYVMSSVEEFFSLIERDNVTKSMQEITKSTNPIASNMSKINPAMQIKPENRHSSPVSSPMNNNKTTNPIAKLRNETKDSYLNGLIVKSGYNIDDNKGFYIVNLDGASALIGRVNEEVTVLKKFDKNVDKLQVRHDKENVYMVKAADFKSLVEVNEDKMGVLIEL